MILLLLKYKTAETENYSVQVSCGLLNKWNSKKFQELLNQGIKGIKRWQG